MEVKTICTLQANTFLYEKLCLSWVISLFSKTTVVFQQLVKASCFSSWNLPETQIVCCGEGDYLLWIPDKAGKFIYIIYIITSIFFCWGNYHLDAWSNLFTVSQQVNNSSCLEAIWQLMLAPLEFIVFIEWLNSPVAEEVAKWVRAGLGSRCLCPKLYIKNLL